LACDEGCKIMKNINAEIIAVGTELLLGQIANTNAQWISKQLALDGINVFYHTVVGDNLKRVEESFRQAESRSNIIIITGGLGPTEDDLTREAFQLISGLKLIEHQPSMEKINAYFKNEHTQMTKNNRRQARVFKDAKVIKNKVGMAPGMIVNHAGKIWMFLPGVPTEMKQMMLDDFIPYVREQFGSDVVIRSKILRFIGIGEANLEDRLQDLILEQTNPTIALLAQNDGIIIRLTAKAESEKTANNLLLKTESKIKEKVGNYLYGTGNDSIEKKIAAMLKEKHLTLSAAESLTGGMFIEKVISIPVTSIICPGGIVCYDKQTKTEILGVSRDMIETKGTISSECAEEMASQIKNNLNTNIGISFTGVAGPGSSEEHLPGTVFIGLCDDKGYKKVEKFVLQGDRESI